MTGVCFDYYWRPGVNEAKCWSNDGKGSLSWFKPNPNGCDPAPGDDCPGSHNAARGCGFYVFTAPPTYAQQCGPFMGLVQVWGRVIEHEFGVRAQYARIVALALRPRPHVRGHFDAAKIKRIAPFYEASLLSSGELFDLDFASEFGEVVSS